MSLSSAWYGPRRKLALLWPLHVLMRALIALRQRCYRWRLFASSHPGIPVIVVGNITVGGAGKTPMVLWLAEYLRAEGWRPGIVSRGYGGKAERYPCEVGIDSSPAVVGDEPLLLKQKSAVPVLVDPQRARAAKRLRELGCDIVISDDGLQHYALRRDIEIVVIDAIRQLGNGWLLPAGPLRELPARLATVSLRVANGALIPGLAEHVMHLQPVSCRSLRQPTQQQPLSAFAGQHVHAVAGIGNPARFFATLQTAGLAVVPHAFADHHAFRREDLPWMDAPVLMTEKDAVKCADLLRQANPHNETLDWWAVAVQPVLNEEFSAQLSRLLAPLRQGVKHG